MAANRFYSTTRGFLIITAQSLSVTIFYNNNNEDTSYINIFMRASILLLQRIITLPKSFKRPSSISDVCLNLI